MHFYTGSWVVFLQCCCVGMTLVVMPLTGCTSVTPHENFVDGLNSAIGTSVDIEPMLSLCSRGVKNIESRTLQNGYVEDRQVMRRGHRECVYYCVVDPKTRLVVSARFEGSADDCTIPP